MLLIIFIIIFVSFHKKGNELDYALRQIGREDVIKSCMRDIRYVLDADEHAKVNMTYAFRIISYF